MQGHQGQDQQGGKPGTVLLVRVLTARDIKDKINRVGNQVQYWNLQESLVRVLTDGDIRDIKGVGN